MGVNRVAPIITGQSNAQTIKGSLRFDSGSSQYLNKTLSSGNRRTWTWSGWVKKLRRINVDTLFSAYSDGNNFTFIRWENSQSNLRVATQTGGVYDFDFVTTQYFRDYTGWMHVVISCDTTRVDSDRVKIYINGKSIESFSTNTQPSQNVDTFVNHNISHYIATTSSSPTSSFYLSNVYLIDGQALGPGFFGFTDPLTGTWRPKRLKDGAPTVNNGTDWAANYTGSVNPGLNVNNLWDGSTSTYVNNVWGSTPLEYTLPPVHFETLEIYGASNGGGTNYIKVNGINVTKQFNQSASNSWTTITGVKGPLTTITTYTASAGDYNSIYAVRVDGVVMVRNTTTNVNFGTNGFYLPLDDQNDYTTDKSGKGNNWTANGFTGDFSNPDVVSDSPSGVVGSTKPTSGITTTSSITKPTNYATLNPLQINNMNVTPGATLSDGNLKLNNAVNTSFGTSLSTLSMTSGKWYFEGTASGTSSWSIGIYKIDPIDTRFYTDDESLGYSATGYGYRHNGQKENNLVSSSYGDTYTSGDTIGVALDLDAGTISFYKNGVIQNSGTPAYTGLSGEYAFGVSASETATVWYVNFGQKPFKHQPPAGYLTLCSANLRPSTVVTRPGDYVGITTYKGNNGTQNINVGLKPDLVWIKNRHYAASNAWFDSVRGANQYLSSNATIAEFTPSTGGMTSFNNDGFTVVSNTPRDFNSTGDTYVGWCWKAGGNKGTYNVDDVGYATTTAAGLTNGTHAHLVTGASVGTKQGFSIIGFDASAMASAAVELPHGLTETPGMIIVKARDSGPSAWYTWHQKLSNIQQNRLFLNGTNAEAGNTSIWNNTAPTNTTFWVGGDPHNNDNAIAYVWHDVPGVQKFGTYEGNTNTNGPFVELGFRPALVLVKNIDDGTTDWKMYDAERNKYNVVTQVLYPNLGNAEDANTGLDFLSNGFKLRDSGTAQNANTIVYAAWAEAPSFNLFGGQSLAR